MTSPAPQTERLARRLAVAVLVLVVITLAALTYARVAADRAANASEKAARASQQAKAASEQAKATVACVNNILGARAAATEADAKAHITLAQEQQRFNLGLAAVLNAPKAQQASLYTTFLADLSHDVAASRGAVKVLADDQAYRDTHPLGLCH